MDAASDLLELLGRISSGFWDIITIFHLYYSPFEPLGTTMDVQNNTQADYDNDMMLTLH